MTPREEMELAAKAYGVTLHWKEGSCKGGPYESAFIERGGELVPWRPLEDDGDAFRLAVSLGLTINPYQEGVFVSRFEGEEVVGEPFEVIGQPDTAAARLAIFRAAVALGKCLP